LLRELGNGFELSPRESHLVLETAKGILLEHWVLERRRVWTVGVEVGQTAGKRMYEAKKKEVILRGESSAQSRPNRDKVSRHVQTK